jgi:hypothetical protein
MTELQTSKPSAEFKYEPVGNSYEVHSASTIMPTPCTFDRLAADRTLLASTVRDHCARGSSSSSGKHHRLRGA